MNKYMEEANKEAIKNEQKKFKNGGPFGAIIVKENKIIARAHNTVLKQNDPTAHAEINVIRKACKKLKTHNLSNCTLYTTCYPCPMCLSAIIWANIQVVYYGNTQQDANNIGFKDKKIHDFLTTPAKNNSLKLINIDRKETIKTFKAFNNNKKLY